LGRIFHRFADNRVYRRKHWQVPAEIAINQGLPTPGAFSEISDVARILGMKPSGR